MADVFSSEKRSQIMAAVKDRNTKPELRVRSAVHRLGYRYRLHDPKLPGKPDLVLKRHRKVIFVHGCFWHQHPDCKHAERPTSNVTYWHQKLDRNTQRDAKNIALLERLGWDTLVIWECETRDPAAMLDRLVAFLRR